DAQQLLHRAPRLGRDGEELGEPLDVVVVHRRFDPDSVHLSAPLGIVEPGVDENEPSTPVELPRPAHLPLASSGLPARTIRSERRAVPSLIGAKVPGAPPATRAARRRRAPARS